MVDIAKLLLEGKEVFRDVPNFRGETQKIAYLAEGRVESAVAWMSDLAKGSTQRSVMSVAQDLSGIVVRDYGIAPPLSRNVIDRVIGVASQKPFQVRLEYSAAELSSAAKQLLDASPLGGFPLKAFDGDPVLGTVEVAKWGANAVRGAADVFGVKIPNEINAVLNSGAIDVAVDIYKSLPPNLHDTWKLLQDGAASIAGLNASAVLGAVDWSKGAEIASMSVQAMSDGIVSQKEAEQIGAASGALLGAAIGSVIPGVGTVIGGAIGSLAGLFAGQLGQKTAPAGIHEAFKQRLQAIRAAEEQQRLAALAQREAWVNECNILYSLYFEKLKACIELVAQHWADLEARVGWRFDIRWFDPNPGKAFVGTGTLVPKKVYAAGKLSHTENYLFCNTPYGCAYPVVSNFDKVPVEAGFDDGTRAAAALAARGFAYGPKTVRIPPSTTEYSRCQYWAGMHLPGRDLIKSFSPGADLQLLSTELARLNYATNLVILDLNRTAAMVQAEKDMWQSRTASAASVVNLGAFGRYALMKSVASGSATSVVSDNLQNLKKTSPDDPLVKKVEATQVKQDMERSILLYLGGTAIGYFAYDFIRSRR